MNRLFLFAGHETSSSMISFTFWQLATHPEVQERCKKEIDAHFSKFDIHEMEEEHFHGLTYVKQVLNESLRCYPPVRLVIRCAEETVEMPSGYTVPKGTNIFVNILALHRNPKVWEQPDVFNPDRFSDQNLKQTFPENGPISLRYAFAPFILGTRNCIGKDFAFNEALVITSLLLYYFNVEMTEEANKNMFIQTSLVSSPNNLMLKFTQRRSIQM